jgi:hypothetical protein
MTKVFVPIKSTKVFGGKDFSLAAHHPLKRELQDDAKVYKKLGYLARIVKRQNSSARKNPNDPYSRSGVMWCLYVRRK